MMGGRWGGGWVGDRLRDGWGIRRRVADEIKLHPFSIK